MKVTHRAELTDDEVKTLEDAMNIMCDIAEEIDPEAFNITAEDVFCYLFEGAHIDPENNCTLSSNTIDLTKIKR